MKIGVLGVCHDKVVDPALMARAVEDMGFESFFMGEHTAVPVDVKSAHPSAPDHVMPDYYYEVPSPLIGLAFAAAATKRIRIGTSICLVAEHHPLELAKTVATLDRYSGGRLIFGIGSGWNAEEAALFNIDFKRRWGITRDYVQAMIALWTQHDSAYEGKYTRFPTVRQYPKPVQKPYPPIHIGAFVDVALKDVATYASGWMPGTGGDMLPIPVFAQRVQFVRRICEEAGRDFNEIEITCMVTDESLEPRRLLDEYRAAGAHRLVFFCPGNQGAAPEYGIDGMRRRLDQIAAAYLTP
ncbi:MAG: LLM class F420-dependent oxidoreductase [Gammaproteobacteria bacterium]